MRNYGRDTTIHSNLPGPHCRHKKEPQEVHALGVVWSLLPQLGSSRLGGGVSGDGGAAQTGLTVCVSRAPGLQCDLRHS